MQRRWRGGGGVACVCCGAAAARLAARRPRGSGSAVPWRWWRGAVVATWQGQECGGCVKTVTHTQQATARREERRDRQNTHTHPKPFQREEERLKTTKKNCPAAPTPPPTGGDLRRPSWEGATSRCDLKAAFLRVRGGPRSCRAPPVACEVQSSAACGARGHGAEGLPRGARSPREALSLLALLLLGLLQLTLLRTARGTGVKATPGEVRVEVRTARLALRLTLLLGLLLGLLLALLLALLLSLRTACGTWVKAIRAAEGTPLRLTLRFTLRLTRVPPIERQRVPVARLRSTTSSTSLCCTLGRADRRPVCSAECSPVLPLGSAAREAASAARAGVAVEASCGTPPPGQFAQLGPQLRLFLRHLSHLAAFDDGRPRLRGAPTGISLVSAVAPASRARSWGVGGHERRVSQPVPYFCGSQARQEITPAPSCRSGTALLIVMRAKIQGRLGSLVLVAPELVAELELLWIDAQRARRSSRRASCSLRWPLSTGGIKRGGAGGNR